MCFLPRKKKAALAAADANGETPLNDIAELDAFASDETAMPVESTAAPDDASGETDAPSETETPDEKIETSDEKAERDEPAAPESKKRKTKNNK